MALIGASRIGRLSDWLLTRSKDISSARQHGEAMIKKEEVMMHCPEQDNIFHEEPAIKNADQLIASEEPGTIDGPSLFAPNEGSQESWTQLSEAPHQLLEDEAVELWREDEEEAASELVQCAAGDEPAAVAEPAPAPTERPVGMSSSGQVENLTWVQRQVMMMEMEITKQREAANRQWKSTKIYQPEEFAYISSKGSWVKYQPETPRKPKRLSSNLFSCFGGLFSRSARRRTQS